MVPSYLMSFHLEVVPTKYVVIGSHPRAGSSVKRIDGFAWGLGVQCALNFGGRSNHSLFLKVKKTVLVDHIEIVFGFFGIDHINPTYFVGPEFSMVHTPKPLLGQEC